VNTMTSRKKVEFKRYLSGGIKRLDESWRRPKGMHNKLREHVAAKGPRVQVGYGSPRELRGTHPCGLREALVHNVKELEALDPQSVAVRIASNVGRKKRLEIEAKAAELGFKILNPIS